MPQATNPFELSKFLAFVESRAGKYNFWDLRRCAFGQYVYSNGGNYLNYQYWFNGVVARGYGDCIKLAGQRPFTFGALATRIRAALAKAGA